MGKLNIAHHKSYHPYRADNIARVKRDEEEARLKEAIEDGRVSLADSEARIALLRERAKAESKPSKRQQERDEEKTLQSGNPLIAPSSDAHTVSKEKGVGGALTLTSASGHVNFFEELEYSHQNTLEHGARARTKAEIDKARERELERGVPLMPDAKDRNPWYLDKGLKHPKDMTDEEVGSKEAEAEAEREKEKWGKRARGSKVSSKASLDPLKEMKSHLAARSQALSRSMPPPPAPPSRPSSSSSAPKDAATERAARESAERARAEALIAKRRAELEVSSSIGGDTPHSVRDGGYSDMFNKKETREAHAAWGRYTERRWDEDREDRHRDRDRGERRERSRERRRDRSRESRRRDDRDRDRSRDRETERSRDRQRGSDKDRDRHRDMPRGERNRTRGVDDVRKRS